MAGGIGMKTVRKTLKSETMKRVRNSGRVSSKKKARLMESVYAQINATVKKEKARRSKERKVEAVVENDSEAVVTEKEIAAVYNYPSTLAR